MSSPSSNQITAPPMEDIVPCKVNYQERKVTDKYWGILNILMYIAFLITGIIVVARSHPRHQVLSDSSRGLSAYYMNEAKTCCNNNNGQGYVCSLYDNTLGVGSGRRLAAGTSKFDGDEGIFDAFSEAPGIVIGILAVVLGVSIIWTILLRYFAKPIVILVEVAKIALMITFGILNRNTTTRVFCFIFAALMIAYVIYTWKSIMFASKIITHSTISMKENPSIFGGSFFTQLLYAGNAGLFVLFFSKSFDVVDIVGTDGYCDFYYPAYVSRLSIFWSLAYLWVVLFFDQMRLSIIATIVGSWHFHEEDMPSVFIAVKNSIKSFGTLSVTSLIATIAEKVNRKMSENACLSCITPTIFFTFPIDCCLCIFGACIHTCVKMLTSYAVVLHVFTGGTFLQSAKNSFSILSRHFKGGFVTEVTSRSLFSLASYAFSFCVALIAWVWIDAEFQCQSLPTNYGDGGGYFWIIYIIAILFNLYYPVLGLYLMIIINKFVREYERAKMIQLAQGYTYSAYYSQEEWEQSLQPTNHLWIPPLAATFIGCIAMMFFMFLSNIFLDIITTLFLCFAIDRDNQVDLNIRGESAKEFDSLVKEMPDYIAYVKVDEENGQTPIPVAVPVSQK